MRVASVQTERSKSKRQVLILDCCYSGAFAQDMNAKEIVAKKAIVESIQNKIQQEFGGEGRAVLTSSTATQVSFEDAGGGLLLIDDRPDP